MIALIYFILSVSTALFKSKSRLEVENAALRHQVVVLQRKVRSRIEFSNHDRLFSSCCIDGVHRSSRRW
jgi:hypothetical protein